MTATKATSAETSLRQAAIAYSLRLGDDAFILSHRLAEWIASAPELEEDVALANISLDLLGQARLLLGYAGELEGSAGAPGRSEDDLAFLRDDRAFLNCLLVEQPNGDFAATIARQLFFTTYQLALYQALLTSVDERLAAIAAKAVKEVAYHRDHTSVWTVRLGDGTQFSRSRMQAAVIQLWPYVDELFDSDDVTRTLAEVGVTIDPPSLRAPWDGHIRDVLAEATLDVPEPGDTLASRRGGRSGLHSESFGYLIAEMQHVHRSYPGAKW